MFMYHHRHLCHHSHHHHRFHHHHHPHPQEGRSQGWQVGALGARWKAASSAAREKSGLLSGGIRGAFAVIFGGHSGGIRGHSRAFAGILLQLHVDGCLTKIMISLQFFHGFWPGGCRRPSPKKTNNSCRADPLYNTSNENEGHRSCCACGCTAVRAS